MKKITETEFREFEETLGGEIHRSPLRNYMHSTDGSIFRRQPTCVVYPKDTNDVALAVRFAAANGLSIHPRGAGSGLCGSAVGTGMVIDFAKYMNHMISLDIEGKSFSCRPGFRMGELDAALSGSGLFFPPDPSSGEYATFGGMFNTNASGARSVKYGNVGDYLMDAEVVLSTGEVITLSGLREKDYKTLSTPFRALYDLYAGEAEKIEAAYPDIRCNTTGYNLRGMVEGERLELGKLLAGSEGTLGIVTELTFRLVEKPPHESLIVAYFGDIVSSAKATQKILELNPCSIEIMDRSLLALARENDASLREKIPGDIDNLLLIGFDEMELSTTVEKGESVISLLREEGLTEDIHLAVSAEEKEKFWAVRKAAVPILYKLKGPKKILALIEDAAVPTDKLVEYFKGIYRILEGIGVRFVVYGHIAKGLMHTRPLLDLKDVGDVKLLKVIADEVFELIRSLGGAISGEHGDGRLRSAYIRRQYPDIHDLFKKAKAIIDPGNMLNPEIITVHDPDQVMHHLRYGEAYNSFDRGCERLGWKEGFVDEIEKCHGCSKCTTVTTATRMCPVYKATRDEAAAPKAKANILRALVSGAVAEKSLYEKAFTHVMDHCIACGSCHRECPSNVNIPKLAMEARARYVERFGASLGSRLVVNVEAAARSTRGISCLAKPLIDLPAIRRLGEKITGISAEREFVPFAARPLARRMDAVSGKGRTKVLYFSGCYAGYIRPAVGTALIETLTAMDMTVYTPEQHCCGLPMMTKGMVGEAKGKLQRNLQQWGKLAAEVDYIVVSCSSCGLALKEEWASLAGGTRGGTDLVELIRGKTVHVSTLVNERFHLLENIRRDIKVAYHTPCHLKVQDDSGASARMLAKIPGVELDNLTCNCCGMAGSWGLFAENYSLSRQIGSDLIDKLDASKADAGVTDCPTCTLQMEAFGNKEVLHPIEILHKGIEASR